MGLKGVKYIQTKSQEVSKSQSQSLVMFVHGECSFEGSGFDSLRGFAANFASDLSRIPSGKSFTTNLPGASIGFAAPCLPALSLHEI